MKSVIFAAIFFSPFVTVLGQEIFPVITDFPSKSGSDLSMVQYLLLKNQERKMVLEVNNFNRNYAQRSLYLQSPLSKVITEEINLEMATTLERFFILEQRNNSLSIFHHNQKKTNKKLLDIIQQMIVNLKNELDKQHSSNVLLGEKMNLYQNAMSSTAKIQRELDAIEDTIENTKLINKILGRN